MLAEDELAEARQQNRDMKIERHEALIGAETAEASLEAATRRRVTSTGSAPEAVVDVDGVRRQEWIEQRG